MRCYYQGTLQVTGGNINDVERAAMAYIGKWIYVEGSQENTGALVVIFQMPAQYANDVRGFIAEAEKCGWNVSGTLSYYGDYEGFMVIADNVIEEVSSEEMAIRKYLDTPSVKAEKELADKAVSMAAYLFLRFVYGKEDYPETVIENLEWVVEELLKGEPAEILAGNVRCELQEGDYGNRTDIISDRLAEFFDLNKEERRKISSLLYTWGSGEVKGEFL